MTARNEDVQTPDEVVADNIKRLRKRMGWTATELAKMLTRVLERDYTRFTVADLEGRREREIRWVELAALCAIFDVPLWKLVLPPEGVEVDTLIATGAITQVDLPEGLSLAAIGGRGTAWHDYPDRDALAWRLFSLDSKNLDSGNLERFARTEAALRQLPIVDALVDALLPRLREGLGGLEEE